MKAAQIRNHNGMQLGIALLGTLGIVAMESSYVPQLWRLFRVKHAEEVSLLLPGLSLGGRLCAIAYAHSQGQQVFVAGFLVGVLLRAGLLSQVAYYRHQYRRRLRQKTTPLPTPTLALVTSEPHDSIAVTPLLRAVP